MLPKKRNLWSFVLDPPSSPQVEIIQNIATAHSPLKRISFFLGKIVLFERSLTSSSILFKTIFWITTSHELISIFEPCWFLLFIDRKAGEIIRLIAPSVRVCETYLCQLVWWNHDMSPKVTMLNWRIFGYLWWFNMVTFDDIFQFNMVTSYDIWWYLVAFDDNWRFCVTKPHRLSWYVMTYHTLSWYLTNQFREVHCALPQSYRAMLRATDLHCAPTTCVVHHGAQDTYVLWGSAKHFLTVAVYIQVTLKNRSPLCTMVHNAGQWCTMQVDGAQRSSVPLKWCTM